MIECFLIYQSLITLYEFNQRHIIYDEASKFALSQGKPLIVIGGTKNRHPSGDLCIDINPKSCINANSFLLADIRSIPLPDKYAGAVFASHVLEHLPTIFDAKIAINELIRISDKVFLLYPSRLNILAWLHPDHHLWLYKNNNRLIIEQR